MLSWCAEADKWLRPRANCRKLNESALVDLAPAVSLISAIIVNERHSVVIAAHVFSVLLGAETSTGKHDVKIGNGSIFREQHEIRCR